MTPLAITFTILGVSIALLLSERLRPDLVALLGVVSLAGSGVLTQQEAFSGFSRGAVVTMMAVFILAEGLVRTGLTDRVGALLLRIAGQSERLLLVLVMGAGALLSLFMNNIAAASLLMPAVAGAARRVGTSPSRLLMPLAFATILGGMATLFTTTNIVASGLLRDAGQGGFGVLAFAPLGLPLLLAGVAYMVVWGRHLLPRDASPERQAALEEANADLIRVYRLGENLFRVRVPLGSTLSGRRLSELHLRDRYECSVLAIEREPRMILSPAPEVTLQEQDVLVLKGDLDELRRRDTAPFFEILPSPPWTEDALSAPQDVLVEAMLSPRSALIGKTLRAAHFRARYGFNVLAIWRAGDQIRTGVRDTRLVFGDALLLQGPRAELPLLRNETDFILMTEVDEGEVAVPIDRGRRFLVMGIFGLTFLVSAMLPERVPEVLLGGAVATLLSGVLTMDEAYRAIDWKSIFLIAGLLPLGLAMAKTGAAHLLVSGIISVLSSYGHVAVLAALCAISMLLTQAMSGAAVTAVVGPVALQAAADLGLDARALMMGVALSTSMAFLTPLGSPVNILVMGQGGYRFRDYARVGAGLTGVVFVLLMVLLPLLWPLSPP